MTKDFQAFRLALVWLESLYLWLCNQTNRKTSRLLYRVLGFFKLTVAAPHFFDRIKWSVIWCLCGLKKVNTAHAIDTVCPVENLNFSKIQVQLQVISNESVCKILLITPKCNDWILIWFSCFVHLSSACLCFEQKMFKTQKSYRQSGVVSWFNEQKFVLLSFK